jgi:peptidoglycan/xylan/chitin deacetylase (PgdA/CDA1 family)
MQATAAERLKAGVRRLMATTYYQTGRFKDRLRGKVAILTYHRVLTRRELDAQFVQPGMYVLADVFERQMQFLSEHFQVLTMADLFCRWGQGGLDDDGRYCAVTFDDGWLDNYQYAYPVLRRLGIPATIFLPTEFVGTDAWFWPERLAYLLRRAERHPDRSGAWARHVEEVIEEWKARTPEAIERGLVELGESLGVEAPPERAVVSWEEVAEMAGHGISFGSHSATHAILTNVPAEVLEREIDQSLRVLEERSGNCLPVFCYPNGGYSDVVARRVESAGYIGAVTADFGWETGRPADLFKVHRIGVHNDISQTTPLFAFHLAGLNSMRRR